MKSLLLFAAKGMSCLLGPYLRIKRPKQRRGLGKSAWIKYESKRGASDIGRPNLSFSAACGRPKAEADGPVASQRCKGAIRHSGRVFDS